ncbi:MAG: DUF1464 family protein [Sulfolobales archaeon]
MKVLAIDPGTLSTGIIVTSEKGLEDYIEVVSEELSREPEKLLDIIESNTPNLVVAPSGYGLPPIDLRSLDPAELATATLVREDDPGVGGLRYISYFLKRLKTMRMPVIGIPGVANLASVPSSRKINRIDLGTADKVALTVLAAMIHSNEDRGVLRRSSFIVVELGAFTAAVAVKSGKIIDGIGGTLFPIGIISSGGWDGEMAVAIGRRIYKRDLFSGGLRDICGSIDIEIIRSKCPEGYERYLDDIAKTISMLQTSIKKDRWRGSIKIYMSGRGAVKAIIEDLWKYYEIDAEILRNYYRDGIKKPAEGAALYGLAWIGVKDRGILETLGIFDWRPLELPL